MPVRAKSCHPGPGDEWLSVDENELTDLILIAPSRRHLLHLENNHTLTTEQNRLWNWRWAKLSIVGDKPGVKSLAWHSVVALLSNAPLNDCISHECIKTPVPENSTQCTVHAPQRVTMENARNKHPLSESNACSFPCTTKRDSFLIDVLGMKRFSSCTDFTSLVYKGSLIKPPLIIPKKACPNPVSFSKGPTLQYIPSLQNQILVHSCERIMVASFNIFDVQLNVRYCKVCNKIF